MRHIGPVVWLASLLAGGTALAQDETTKEPADTTAPAAEAPSPEPQPAKEKAAPPAGVKAAPPAGATKAPAHLDAVQSKTQEPDKSGNDVKGILDKTSKLKITGFIQGRYEWHDDSVNGWDYGAKPTGTGNAGSSTKSTFYIRRARLDTVYAGTNAEFVLQLDAGGDSVALRDAEAAFVDTWTPVHLRISVGQFKYPFGYEIQQGDPIREMPERSRMIQQIFAGERDRGLKIQGSYKVLRFQVALINGNGIQDPIFKAGKDGNGFLDVVGRLGLDFKFLAGGFSMYYGAADVYNPNYNATTNPDTNPMNLKKYQRVRVGGDLQGYVDVPSVGNLSLRGEIIYGRDKNKDYNGVAADACQDRVSLGWSLIAAQNVGKYLGAVVRVDSYDPLLQGSLSSTNCSAAYEGARKDRVMTYGAGALVYVSPNLKLTLAYEHPAEQTGKKTDNDIVTAQLQARF